MAQMPGGAAENAPGAMPDQHGDVSQQTLGLLTRRIGYLFLIILIANGIDRSNVSFAALSMNSELGFSPQVYGFCVSAFFFGYIAAQFPGMLLTRRYGVRAVLGGMLISWGVCASLMSTVHSPTSFAVVRILLGLTEGAIMPVSILYYSMWFPKVIRGGASSKSMLGATLSTIVAAPLSGWLMTQFNGSLGFPGWRWMFLLEGLPSIALGFYVLLRLPNRPQEATWLDAKQKDWLIRTLAAEAVSASRVGLQGFGQVIRSSAVWICALAWFVQSLAIYGALYWLPQAIKHMSGYTDLASSVLSAFPWVGVAIAMVFNARHSDRAQERRWHFVLPDLVGALALSASVALHDNVLSYLLLIVGLSSIGAGSGIFWSIPMGMVSGRAAAPSFAFINFLAACGGFVSPNLIAWVLKLGHGSYVAVGYTISAIVVAGVLPILLLKRESAPATDGEAAPLPSEAL